MQYELIQTVENILFFPSRSRQEDALILQETRRSSAQLNSQLLNGVVDASSGNGANSSFQAHTPEEKRLLEAVVKAGIVTSPTLSTESSVLPDLGGETFHQLCHLPLCSTHVHASKWLYQPLVSYVCGNDFRYSMIQQFCFPSEVLSELTWFPRIVSFSGFFFTLFKVQ